MSITGVIDSNYYILVYAGLAVLTIVFSTMRVAYISFSSIVASRKLHSSLLHKILRSPIRFFETTPMGRILNRMSKDIKDVDNEVAFYTADFLQCLIRAFVFLIIILFVTPYAVLGIVPVGIVYVLIARKYINSARELKRMDSMTRSPLFSHFGEAISY
jgi:ABC-type multidrug transport system fused ATPase/permease subunit